MLPPVMATGLLADGEVALTFDDGPGETIGPGPGPRTVELATYLADQGIGATFFMCGVHVEQHPEIPRIVLDLGHRVGNHTHAHPSLVDLADAALVREQVASCLGSLHDAGVTGPVPFRPPYGDWDAASAAAVNADPALVAGLTGVFGWDVDGDDWRAWDVGGAPEPVADRYFGLLREKRGGVVLMHDSTADPGEDGRRRRAGNRALDVVRLLVPALRADGFRVVAMPESS